jgi:Tol biopolymer transport system component/dienelactone hydrolase
MGTGLVLVLGSLMSKAQRLRSLGTEDQYLKLNHPGTNSGRRVEVVLLLAAAGMMGMQLLKSYSRGAWFATAAGMSYLVYAGWRFPVQEPDVGANHGGQPTTTHYRAQIAFRRWQFIPSMVVLVAGVLVIAFLNLRHSEHRMVRRALSVANINDFSWRNRATTSLGALKVIADNPLGGAGWNRCRAAYDAWYRPESLLESAAIGLNDYLILGMTLGVPALACLAGYIIWQFGSGHSTLLGRGSATLDEQWNMAVYRAGFLVLLVGFVPETGLLHLSLGAPFWILLELGAARPDIQSPKSEFRAPASSISGTQAEAQRLRTKVMRWKARLAAGGAWGPRTRTWLAVGLISVLSALLAWAYFRFAGNGHEPDTPLYRRIRANFQGGQPVGVSISPDGRYILTKNEVSNGFQVAITERSSGRVVISDSSKDTQRALTWRPDSQAIVFQESVGVNRPLYSLDIWSRRKCQIGAPVSQSALLPLRWDPAGKRLAYFQGDWNKGRLVVVTPQREEGHRAKSADRRPEAEASAPNQRRDGTVVVIREMLSANCDFVWSPDGTRVAVADESEPGGITLVRLADLKQSRISTKAGGVVRELAWSPDGSCVLATVRGVGDEFFKLFRLELRGGTATLQAEALGDIGNPVWLPDGRSFLYQVLSNGVTSMVLASKDGPGGKVVGPTNGVLRVSHVAADGSRAYARYAGPTAPAVLVEIALGGSAAQPGAAVLVYAPSNSAEMKCPEPKTLCVRALDGSAIPGYHWTAPGRAGPPKGALIVAHGGLHTQTFPTWEAYLPALLNQGCDVIAVNYRGSSGYGHRFERMEGEPERVSDVLAARDYAVKVLRVPPQRVFLSGISHGASLAAAAATQGEEIGGLVLVSWVGPIREIETEFVRPFPILAFHGDQDATVADVRAQAALREFVAPAGDLMPCPRWRLFKGEGHFFYRAASWAEVYWETAKLIGAD